MTLTDVGAWANVATTVAVIVGVIIYQRQLQAMTRARELESLLVIMKYVDNIDLRRARYFMLEHWEELSGLFAQSASWETRHAIEAKALDLSGGTIGIHEIDLAVNALNNVCFLVREEYAPPATVESFMRNSLLHAWEAFEPYIKHRRTRPDTVGTPSQYGAHFESVVQKLKASR
jgi:hypothetical protein